MNADTNEQIIGEICDYSVKYEVINNALAISNAGTNKALEGSEQGGLRSIRLIRKVLDVFDRFDD